MSRLVALVAAVVLFSAEARAQVVADGRDGWTLLGKRLVNRELFEQLGSPGQEFRLGRGLGRLALAAEGNAGVTATGVVFGAKADSAIEPLGLGRYDQASWMGRYHAWVELDGFASVRIVPGLDVNLNLTFVNPSASDGFRDSAQVLEGVAVHVRQEVLTVAGHPVRVDALGMDLDLVTLGAGLLLEEVPLEGFLGGVSWNGNWLRLVWGGRGFWPTDDVHALGVGVLDGRLQGWVVNWVSDTGAPLFDREETFFTVSADFPFARRWRAAAEVGALRKESGVRKSLLCRLDFLDRELGPLQLHAGLQLRHYDQGFRILADAPTTSPATLWRSRSYVTSYFEAARFAGEYDQWWATGMVEARLHAWKGLWAVVELEGMVRRMGGGRAFEVHDLGWLPGSNSQLWYRAAVELFAWPGLPHRAGLGVSNKMLVSGNKATDAVTQLFLYRGYLVIDAEVHL